MTSRRIQPPPQEDDSDLEDLLSTKPLPTRPTKQHRSVDITLDDITKKPKKEHTTTDELTKLTLNPTPSAPYPNLFTFLSLLFSHFCLVLSHRPKASICLLLLLVVFGVTTFQKYVVERNNEVKALIDTDYSDVKSIYDLSVGQIDHWCLVGDDDSCNCEDPLEPTSRGEFRHWITAHNLNKNRTRSAVQSLGKNGIDVVFIGESIPEEWDGRVLGRNTTRLDDIKKSFQRRFSRDKGALFEGLPLGIAGDTAPNVLWRLLNKEMNNLYPKVWWLILGRNDLSINQCSEEVVLLGILRIIEQIRTNRPDAKIVVNSLLPMTFHREGRLFSSSSSTTETSFFTYILSSPKRPKINSYWPSARAINEQLRQFSQKHKHVYYFDADDIFIEQTSRGEYVKRRYVKDFRSGHPSEVGYVAWQKAIVGKLKILLKEERKKRVEKKKKEKKGNSKEGQKSDTEKKKDEDDKNETSL